MNLFVDTSAWCALFNSNDTRHEQASELWKKIVRDKVRLAASDYIIDETLTLIRNRAHFAAAKTAGEKILASAILQRMNITEREFLLSWEWFKKYKDHKFSFTDCTSFVLMKEHKIHNAWSFDEDFREAGFEMFEG